jgi:hypothetical protein
MANPNPQHNPTDGLGVAAYVQVTGTNIVNTSGGSAKTQGTTGVGQLGQGIGSGAQVGGTGVYPVGQYALTLSLSAATVNGVTYADTCQLTTVLADAKNNVYTTSNTGNVTYRSYGDPANSAGSAPSWYRPSNGSATGSSTSTYNPNVASVSSSGLITGRHLGQTIIEVAFPTFDNTLGNGPQVSDGLAAEPIMMVYCQIVCTVIA